MSRQSANVKVRWCLIAAALLLCNAAAQITVYEKNARSYLLTGTWAMEAGMVRAVTKNDTLFRRMPSPSALSLPQRFELTSMAKPSKNGYSIDAVAANPRYECVVYREFNRSSSSFFYLASSTAQQPRPILPSGEDAQDAFELNKTDDGKAVSSFAWAPDGKLAVLLSVKKLYIMQFDPSSGNMSIRRSVETGASTTLFNPSWYDNSHAILIKNNQPALLNASSGEIASLPIEKAAGGAICYGVAVSAERPTLCAVVIAPSLKENLQIWTAVFSGKKIALLKRLPPEGPSLENIRPVWAPGGERIAYITGDRSKGGRNWQKQLTICRIDSTGAPANFFSLAFENNVYPDADPCWSADGGMIFFVFEAKGVMQLACAGGVKEGPVQPIAVESGGSKLEEIREIALNGRWSAEPTLMLAGVPVVAQELFRVKDRIDPAPRADAYDQRFVTSALHLKSEADQREEQCERLGKLAEEMKRFSENEQNRLTSAAKAIKDDEFVRGLAEEYAEAKCVSMARKVQELSPGGCETGGTALVGNELKAHVKKSEENAVQFKSFCADSIQPLSADFIATIIKATRLFKENLTDSIKTLEALNLTWQDYFVENIAHEERSFKLGADKKTDRTEIWKTKIAVLKETARNKTVSSVAYVDERIGKINSALPGDANENSLYAKIEKVVRLTITSINEESKNSGGRLKSVLVTVLAASDKKEVEACKRRLADEIKKTEDAVKAWERKLSAIEKWQSEEKDYDATLRRPLQTPTYFKEKHDALRKEIESLAPANDSLIEMLGSWRWDEFSEKSFQACLLEQTETLLKPHLQAVDRWVAGGKAKKGFDKKWKPAHERLLSGAGEPDDIIKLVKDAAEDKGASLNREAVGEISSSACKKCEQMKPKGECK
jgi:hypothetical protein